ncbi:MAG: LysR family transcriptional regulator substrate-binding protein [Leptolyngbya sp. SIO3F4]|nr:LysR family transcriptional regulator substrate-binding protein [Leptolyngbya sp. SIO3F4]
MLCTLQVKTIVKIIQSFRELYPAIIIEFYDTHLDELTNWLSHGDIDIAITALATETNTSQILFQQKLLLGVPSNHPFAQKQEVMLQELEDQPFIERVKCEILTKQSPSIFEASGVHPYVVYRADHEEWVLALIKAGMGISIMPEWDAEEGVTYVPLARTQPIRNIGLQWNHKQNFELVDLFRSFVCRGTWFNA